MALHEPKDLLVLPHRICLGRKIDLQVNGILKTMKFSLLISPIDFAWGNSKANKPFSLYLPKTTGVHIYLSYKKINFTIEQKIQILKVLSTLILIYCYETKLPLSLNYSEVSWRK